MADYHKDNATFMLYKNWKALFDSLTDEEAGQLIKALFCFASGEGVPELERLLFGMFLMMTQQMNADGEKWEKKCEMNAEKARKRWNKEKNADESNGTSENATAFNGMQEDTTAYDGIQKHTDKIREDKISKDKISKDINNNNGQKTDEQAEPVRVSSAEFEKLWSLYPRKEGRKEAFAAYERAVKHGTTVETIENGIKAYCKHIEDCKIEKQYIKKGSTYFRQEAWNDVYECNNSKKSKESYDMRVAFTPFGAINIETGEKMIFDENTKTWTQDQN